MRTISAQELYWFLAGRLGHNGKINIADAQYAFPQEDWLVTKFARAFQTFMETLKTADYIEQENDCDDFAQDAHYFMRLLHRRTPRPDKVGITAGEFRYVSEKLGAHAILCVVVAAPVTPETPAGMKMLYLEPQLPPRLITLTKEEERSCMLVNI